MSTINLSDFSFLIVDDVRLFRVSVLGILRNLQINTVHQAANGLEALAILKDESQTVDCVITDFDMPEMNGLQFLKSIRTGVGNIRRDLPVAILTGYGDESLVGTALALDVNAFVLKPVQADILASRLERLLSEDRAKEDWILPIESYESIDVDSPVAEVLSNKQSVVSEEPVQLETSSSGEIQVSFDSVQENSVIARDITSTSGRILYEAGTLITGRHITRLKGLKDIGFFDGVIWISPHAVPVKAPSSRSKFDPMASSSTEGGLQRSTFARYGKLTFGAEVPCQRCGAEFGLEADVIRKHNRGILSFLLCPSCTERDTTLLCACVQYMVAKGGFPQTIEVLTRAFSTPDATAKPGDKDVFYTLRRVYKNDPLVETDIIAWVHSHFFNMNIIDKKLECRIDRILADPERVRLLGEAGLSAKRMAINRAERNKLNK